MFYWYINIMQTNMILKIASQYQAIVLRNGCHQVSTKLFQTDDDTSGSIGDGEDMRLVVVQICPFEF